MFRLKLLLLSIAFFIPLKVYAIACTTDVGTYIYNFDFDFDSSQNTPGTTTPWQEQIATGGYKIVSPCVGAMSTYYSGQPSLDMIFHSISDGSSWYILPSNDYFSISTAIAVYDASTKTSEYKEVPFSFKSNNCTDLCRPENILTTGSRVKVRLKILKKFIGPVTISRPVAFLYGNQGVMPEAFGRPMVQLNVKVDFYVPQNCSFDVGDIVTFDFGNIGSANFANGGAGQIPTYTNKVTKKLILECNSVDAGELLTMRTEANNATDDFINSSNPNVGFKVASVINGVEEVFTPNDLSSRKNLILNSESKADILLRAWPISTTGISPEPGPITGEGYLRIDYQ